MGQRRVGLLIFLSCTVMSHVGSVAERFVWESSYIMKVLVGAQGGH